MNLKIRFFVRPVFCFSLTVACLSQLVSCNPFSGPQPVLRQEFVMDTSVSVTLYSPKSEQVFTRIFDMLKQIDWHMRVQDKNSEITAINNAAGVKPVKVSADTFAVATIALDIARLSGGAYDPTIGPIVQLWNITAESPRVPEPIQIHKLLPLIDWRDVVLDPAASTVFLKRFGMQLDFGGTAKGFAAIEAARICREAGVTSALLNMGDSSIFLLGNKPDGKPWRVGIQNPVPVSADQAVERGQILGVVEYGDGVIETSGPYERFFTKDGKRYHHIMDPVTGAPVDTTLDQVTVILPASTRMADGLSTSCIVLGLDKGMKFIEAIPGAAAIFVTGDRKVHLTSRAANLFTLKDAAFTLDKPADR